MLMHSFTFVPCEGEIWILQRFSKWRLMSQLRYACWIVMLIWGDYRATFTRVTNWTIPLQFTCWQRIW